MQEVHDSQQAGEHTQSIHMRTREAADGVRGSLVASFASAQPPTSATTAPHAPLTSASASATLS